MTSSVTSATGITYGPSKHVPNLLVSAEVDQLLTNVDLKTRIAQPRRVTSMDVVPGVSNLDPKFHKVLLDLHEIFKQKEWQAEVDATTGLSVNFIAGGGSRILSVPGVKKLPVGCPIDSNLSIREQIEEEKAKPANVPMYHAPINDHEIELFDWVCKAYFGHVTRTATAGFRKKASTMLPHFKGGRKAKDGDIGYKKDQVERLFKFLAGRTDDWIEPREWQAAQFYLGYVCVERLQADVFEKDRWSNTGTEYVKVTKLLSEMKQTKFLPNASRLAGMRVRTAYGASGTISYALTTAMAPVREAMFAQYGFTYKHRTPSEVSAKINKFAAVLGVDVTQYDQSILAFWLERLCRNLHDIGPFSKAMASLNYYHVSAYAIAPCPYGTNEHPWVAVGTLFNKVGYSFERGLASGTPLNPDIGKIIQTFEIVSRLHRSGVLEFNSFEDVDAFLKGHRKVACLNSSDDTLLLGSSRAELKKVIAVGGYLFWDEETVPAFLGSIYGGKPGEVIGYPNIMSYFHRRLNPEAGIGYSETDPRYHWRAGFIAQDYHYGVHPLFNKATKLLNEVWHKHFGYTFTAVYEKPAYDRDLAMSLATMSEVDRLVIIKPEVIHYMVDANDVSPEVLALTTASLDADTVNHYCTRFHKPDVRVYS